MRMTSGANHAQVITEEFSEKVSGLIEQILAEMKKLRRLGYSSSTLSLTLASIDRMADVQRQLYECMEQDAHVDIVPTQKDLIPEQEIIESMICSGLYGGTRSLQHIMTRVLSRVLKIVRQEATASLLSFRELRKWSRTILAVTAGGLALWKNREPHVVQMAGAITTLAFGYDATHRHSRAIKALKAAEEELATLTQLWTLMLSFGLLHRKMNSTSADTFTDRTEWLDILSRRLVEDFPPSNIISLWYGHFAGGKLLKRLVTCWYAAVGTANAIVPQFLWDSFGPTISVLSFPLYLCMPSLAADVARVHTSSCDIGYVGKVWSTIEMQWAKPLVCHGYNWFTNVKVQQVMVGGQDCLLLSPRKHPGSEIDIVLFLHGGGYIAHIWLADMLHAAHWVQSLGVCVMIPSYPLLPKWPFPEAILRTCDVYECIYVSLPDICGLRARKTIIVGESAGANLAASVCINLVAKVVTPASTATKKSLEVTYCDYGALSVRHGVPSFVDPNRTKSCVDLHVMVDEAKVPIPASVVMVYPPLNMDFHPSMSRVLNIADPLLPLGVLLALGHSYDIQHGAGVADYLKQPLLTPPSILRKFPPTFFMVGGYDPFLDDSVNMHMRIAAAGAPTRLHIYPDLSHGFLSFSKLVPAARPALRDLENYLAEQFQRA